MKKIIAVGDIHARRYWEQLKTHQFDRMVFIGDYFDTLDPIPYEVQIENFNNIIDFKRANPDKVTVLLGNHDYHYIEEMEEYSGFQRLGAPYIKEAIKNALDVMQVCHIEENGLDLYLFSHAGFTKSWCKGSQIDMRNFQDSVNTLFKVDQSTFCFFGYNNYGDDITQGPFWVRPKSLEANSIEGYTQVVGHTGHIKITDKGNYIYIDSPEQYLVITEDARTAKSYDVR